MYVTVLPIKWSACLLWFTRRCKRFEKYVVKLLSLLAWFLKSAVPTSVGAQHHCRFVLQLGLDVCIYILTNEVEQLTMQIYNQQHGSDMSVTWTQSDSKEISEKGQGDVWPKHHVETEEGSESRARGRGLPERLSGHDRHISTFFQSGIATFQDFTPNVQFKRLTFVRQTFDCFDTFFDIVRRFPRRFFGNQEFHLILEARPGSMQNGKLRAILRPNPLPKDKPWKEAVI